MSEVASNQILTVADGPVAEVVNPKGQAPICLVCEHASPAIPPSLGSLGLADADRFSHAVWDPGAADLARRLSELLDAPLVLSRVSRLVYDCNRPPDRDDAMPVRTETVEVPGNRDLTPADRAARVREVYDAFHQTLGQTLQRFAAPPALITIHSFTPVWMGTARKTEIGLLHDTDDRLAQCMLKAAGPEYDVALNEPYSAADGVTHLIARHGTAHDLQNVMVEVRNDLLGDAAAIQKAANALHPMITTALQQMSTA